MPTDRTHTLNWTHLPFDQGEPTPRSLLLTVAQRAVSLLGDQWGAAEGPGGRTGHLRTDHTVFTIGVCEAGDVFLRNDEIGDVMHLPYVNANSSPDDIAEQVAEYVGDLY
ncbi:hypothetical protein [Streptomyces mirabilis]|uniref:hypothetical protein n=1 Tax=Streptomyces mirabilis TaxID=68239 RepID=UPI0022561705|nr:hypothetical protein [Streptomyces mirabilis]MCX4429500.1 hypothetical protein [Streptomyces mirabilis]